MYKRAPSLTERLQGFLVLVRAYFSVRKKAAFLGLVFCCIVYVLLLLSVSIRVVEKEHDLTALFMRRPIIEEPTTYCFPEIKNFREAVEKQAGPDGVILLATSVDRGYLNMALNYYETSIVRNNIKNVLMICIDRQACTELWRRCIPGFLYVQDPAGGGAQEFLSVDFIRKSRRKLYMIQDVLEMGYTPIISDLDIHFNENPLPLLNQPTCDLQLMVNRRRPNVRVVYNGGWMVFRNSAATRRWSQLSVQMILNAGGHTDDQMTLNNVIQEMRDHDEPLSVCDLDEDVFSSGLYYFELGERQFHDSPGIWRTPAVVHNNFITGLEAKTFRFRQHLMWLEDEDGYYSDPTRRYLVYDNPVNFGLDTLEIEVRALRSAIGIAMITNRTLILPRFHCACEEECSELCPFLTMFHFDSFAKQFPHMFREESFLEHPKVPYHIKDGNRGEAILITSTEVDKVYDSCHKNDDETLINFKPENTLEGATDTEIKEWLKPYHDRPLLKFGCLYDGFSGFHFTSENKDFENRVFWGIQFSEVRQREITAIPGQFRDRPKSEAFRKKDAI